jgi:hypothetical protein
MFNQSQIEITDWGFLRQFKGEHGNPDLVKAWFRNI